MRFTYEQLVNNFNKNVAFLSRHYPNLLEMLNVPKGSIRVNLDPEGRLDAFVGSVMVYGGDAYKKSLEQVQRFVEFPVRFLPNYTMSGDPNPELISHLASAKVIQLTGKTVAYSQKPPGNTITLLISVGLGFGFHIELLRKIYHIQHIMIIDLPIFAHLSLYTMDWKALMEEYHKPDRSISIYVSEDFFKPESIDNVVDAIVRNLNQIGPMLAYWGYYFEHLKYNPPVRFTEFLIKSPALQQLYMGFFDDELWSLDWTLEKIERAVPAYYGGHPLPQGQIAFVLGAGPSLDKAIDIIRKYKDRAIIFSCGSTITALEKAEILPDYQIEIERTKYTFDILSEVNKEYLKSIAFIANNPIWTECYDLFMEGYMFLKLNDTGALLNEAGVPTLIWHTGPTVTAAGVAVSSDLGFSEIYLFGVDLGTKALQEHHSRLTNYYTGDSILSKMRPDFNIKYKAVDGGIAYTNTWFLQTAQSIEALIRKYNVKVYNVSDGIHIEGAIPLQVEKLDLENKPIIDKEKVKRHIKRNFDIHYTSYIDKGSIKHYLIKLLSAIDNFLATVKNYSLNNYESQKDLLSHFTTFNFHLKTCNNILFHLIFHDTHAWTTAIVGKALTLEPKERNRLIKEFWNVYEEYLYNIRKSIEKLIEKYNF